MSAAYTLDVDAENSAQEAAHLSASRSAHENYASSSNPDILESLATSNTENDDARSNPGDPSNSKHRARLRAQFLALCFSLFLAGWNDGTIGPLLPRIRQVYEIGYTTASLVFIIACLGYCSGALFNVVFNDSMGLGKVAHPFY
jgi:fucose permease